MGGFRKVMTKIINDQIELERLKLYHLQQQLGLSHPYVIEQSMLLDELINKHYQSYKK